MTLSRRRLLKSGALAGAATFAAPVAAQPLPLPPSIAALKSMRDGVVPVGVDERRGRIENARRHMAEQKLAH